MRISDLLHNFCHFFSTIFIIGLIKLNLIHSHPLQVEIEDSNYVQSDMPRLLIILIDGFRWDYYQRQKSQLPGLSYFVNDGTHAQYVEPIFPSMSFPSWTTIATGLYPENHNILGNYMLHMSPSETNASDSVFQLKDNSTKSGSWWQAAEPIWISVTKQNKKVYLANWARCDVPFEGILPVECSGYVYQDVNSGFRSHLNTALKRLKSGYSLAMVYDDFIDHVGHRYGPDSTELKFGMVQRDANLHELLMNVQLAGLTNKINIVLTSDHGMTSHKDVKCIYLSEYLDEGDVHKVVDYGAIVSIAAMPNRSESLGKSLENIPGIRSYAKQDIPEEFHFKRSKLALDYLLVAYPGFAIVGLQGDKQIPNDNKSSSSNPYIGVHGYFNMTDMRTVFYAKGPAFRKGLTHSSIRLEDQYQIFMKILGLQALPNNGTWDNVKDMFAHL